MYNSLYCSTLIQLVLILQFCISASDLLSFEKRIQVVSDLSLIQLGDGMNEMDLW